MEPTPTLNTPPSKTITFTVDEQEREVYLSYGLQDALLRLVRDVDQIGNLYVDPDIRNAVLEEVLAERTRTGKRIDPKRSFDDYQIDIEEVDKILAWVGDVVTHFFIKVLQNINSRLIQPVPEQIPDSLSTLPLNGSEDSASKNQ